LKKISKYISFYEATRSGTALKYGIDNIPTTEQLLRMIDLAINVFDKVREHFNVPIFVHSFYRSPEINELVGGAKYSQHTATKGAAIDIDGQVYGGVSNKEIFDYIKNNLEWDQLIWEFGTDTEPDWVHVSYNCNKNRKQVLRAKKVNGKIKYELL
jgi:hypothetical protein